MSEVVQRTVKDVHEVAAGLKLFAFLPEPDEIFIDEDGDEVDVTRVRQVLKDNNINIMSELVTISKSGKTHRYYKVDPPIKSHMARLVLQLALGSDPVKEVLSLVRIMKPIENEPESAIALFETKRQAARVVLWRENKDLL